MIGFPIGVWVKSLLALVIVSALTFSHVYAYKAGAGNERKQAMQRSIEVLRKRAETNEQIRNMDDSALCVALGGRMQDGHCI